MLCSQVLWLTRLNLGPGGTYDNSDTFTSGDGGEPMAGDHYGNIGDLLRCSENIFRADGGNQAWPVLNRLATLVDGILKPELV